MSFSTSKLKQNIMGNKQSFIYTILIMVMHLTFGININILGASIVDLRFVFGVPIETMSNVAVAMGFGYLMGALVGWSYKWLNRQLVLTVLLSLMAITIALLPHYGKLWIALVALIVNGIACGAWDASSGFWTVEMWPKGNASLLQFLQFMYGCGAVVAPLVVAPFLYGETVIVNNRNITTEDRIQRLTVPYAFCGFSVAIVPISMLILFFTNPFKKASSSTINPTTDPNTEKSKKSNISQMKEDFPEINSSKQPIPHRKIKLAMCGLCLSAYATAEMGWFGFASALFQSLPVKMSASECAYMMSLFSATFTLGRLITAFITVKLVPDWILTYHYLITLGSICVIYLGRDSQTVIYIGSAALGYGYSAMWPGILAFTERHLHLSDRVCSLYSFLTGLMSLVIPLILGQTFSKHPLMLFWLESLFFATSFVMFSAVRLWIERDARNRN